MLNRVFHPKKEKKKLVHHSHNLKLMIIVAIMPEEQCSTQAATLQHDPDKRTRNRETEKKRERKRLGN